MAGETKHKKGGMRSHQEKLSRKPCRREGDLPAAVFRYDECSVHRLSTGGVIEPVTNCRQMTSYIDTTKAAAYAVKAVILKWGRPVVTLYVQSRRCNKRAIRRGNMREEEVRILGLDQIDNMIVEMLRENARLTFSEIGKAAGISRVAARHRVEQLEKNGVIRGYHADIDLRALPKGIRFMLDIEAAPGYYTEVIETLAASSMLHEIYGTSGKSRIHVIGVAPNSETLGKYASYLYRTTKGIRELDWQILVTTYKNTERGVEYVRHQEPEHLETGGEERSES